MVYLGSGKNSEGYLHALVESFNFKDTPVRVHFQSIGRRFHIYFLKTFLLN